MSETVVLSDELFVRKHWGSFSKDNIHGISLGGTPRTAVRICRDWSAARAFTEDRLEQIRQVEEEIDVVENQQRLKCKRVLERQCECVSCQVEAVCELCVVSRILARLTATRDDLRRGMR